MREHTDGDFPFANDFNAIAREALEAQTHVISGGAVTDGTTNDMTVDVASGDDAINGATVSYGAQTVTLASADPDNDRYDLVVVDDTGSAVDVTGTASTTPTAPSIPSNAALHAIVHVPAGASGVTNSEINDARSIPSIPDTALQVAGVPSGMIAIWSGAITDIPSGWVLCDGNNGTPNLQDQFVVGAGNSYAVGGTGGKSTHALTDGELSSHDHDNFVTTGAAGGHSHGTGNSGSFATNATTKSVSSGSGESVSGTYTSSTASVGDHDHSINLNTIGSDSAHENKPPYHALAYIMKT